MNAPLPVNAKLDPLNLVWIDLEMTGLDPDSDQIIEIATIVTDKELNELAQGPCFAVRASELRLKAMDHWNTAHHSQSGLWQRCLDSTIDLAEAESQTLAFLQQWLPEGKSPICGNSICQDRRFLARGMPNLERYFHYRNLDVSTIKELCRRWAPELASQFTKTNAHLALSDIRESIAELKFYRQHLGALSGLIAN